MSKSAAPETSPTAGWLDREEVESDVISPGPVRRLHSTLCSTEIEPMTGDPTPLLAHWLYFLPHHPLSQAGRDGHPRRGGFLPPIALPRRMWAGGRLEFYRPLRIGASGARRSVVSEIVEKQGRRGDLVFVTVDHEIIDEAGPVLVERQDIVYCAADAPGQPPPEPIPAPETPGWSRRIDPDPVLLFRYSALTFNGYRIHYDRPYATEVEGYPGLVVHGPLIATMLLHELHARHPSRRVAKFAFRALKPVFDTGPFFVCGTLEGEESARLFAADNSGALCMDARADFC